MRENKSWIKIYRKFTEWGWYSDINVSRLFLHLLLSVNYEDKKWKRITVKRGSIITSYGHLSEQTGLSYQQVRTCLASLKSTSEVTTKTTNKYMEVTINKFDDYQKVTSNLTDKQQSNNNQITTTKEYKEDKEDIGGLAKQYLDLWNMEFSKNYKSTNAIEGNLSKWLSSYKFEEIGIAITKIKLHSFWAKRDLEPTWLLRTRNPQGEGVDYIGVMLNLSSVTDLPQM